MDMKKVIIASLLALMVLGCVSSVSAGWFDFLKQDTTININTTSNGSVFVDLQSSNKSVENKTVSVFVETNGANKTFTVNTTSEQALACILVPGQYNITANFTGDDQYNPSNATATAEVTEISQSTVDQVVTDINSALSK